MKDALEELMWDCHRAEGEGTLSNGHTGVVTDPRGEETITISAEQAGGDLETVHNIGVANGIEAFLNQLDEQGYTLIDRHGRKVSKGKHKKLGDAWRAWFKKIDPKLSIVK